MAAAGPEQKIAGRGEGRHNFLHRIGAAAVEFFHGAPEMLRFLGEVIFSFGHLLSGRIRLRWRDLWWEIEEVGPRALLIVSSSAFSSA